MRLRHFSDNEINQGFSRNLKLIERDRLRRHALKAARKLFVDDLSRWRQYFSHRPIVAEQVHDKSATQGIVYSLACEKIPHVEEVARMLTIERSDDLAGIEIGKRHDARLSETERIFHCWRDGTQFRFIHAPPQHRRHFNLDLNAVCPHKQFRDGTLGLENASSDLRTLKGWLHALLNTLHCGVDRCQRFATREDGQVGKVDI